MANASWERTSSIWMGTDVDPPALALSADETADVAIVGSGITGLSTAYELAAKGCRVVVVDRGAIAGGMTSRTTAHLTPFPDDSNTSMVKDRGVESAQHFYNSQRAAVDRVEFLQNELGIACDFRRLSGYLFPAPDTTEENIDKEIEAARQTGMTVSDGRGLPFFAMSTARRIEFPQQATFHPLLYLRGLAAEIRRKGGRIYRDTAVTEISEADGTVTLTTATNNRIQASKVVIATNSPINDVGAIHDKQAPYRTYAMAFEIEKGLLPDALFWDMADPYHYVRLQRVEGRDYLIAGGEDHKSGDANDGAKRFEAIDGWIRTLVPKLGRETHRWSGQVMDTVDYSAFIGLSPGAQNIYISTGDSGQGMTHGVVASLLLPALMSGEAPAWAAVYDPAREPRSALSQYLQSGADAAASFAEKLAPGEISSLDELAPGEGAIMRKGLKKIAAYRSPEGDVIQRSAECSHMGCTIRWNSTEGCWDCGCHGSHFAPDGSVLNGPAIHRLKPA